MIEFSGTDPSQVMRRNVSDSLPCLSTDSDYENANRSADVDVELMAFQSIIGDDYKGHDLSVI